MEENVVCEDKDSTRDDSKEPAARDDAGYSEGKVLSHCEAMLLVKKSIRELLSDPLLSGLSEDITLEELEDVLHLEQGKAITLYLRRFDDSILR